MTEQREQGVEIIEAHQEMVTHIERGASRIRALSGVTIIVAIVLSLSYIYQLLLPFTGVRTVTVDLADPANQVVEALVLVLALLWLYIGVRDLAFSSRMRNQITAARSKEKEIEKRVGARDAE
ncbi:MAG: hypothetical protein OK404_01810 [Thaumarchaeota archaeon]|nr:hypothetical protein [Nitrososphaerota archaeon]